MRTWKTWGSAGLAIGCLLGAASCGQLLGLDDFEDLPGDASSAGGGPGTGASGGSPTSTGTGNVGGTGPSSGGSGRSSGGSGPGGNGSGGGAGGTGGAPVVCNETCIPAVPVGWTGPVAFHEGAFAEPAPACAGAYNADVGTYFGDLDEGTASCNCLCSAAQGIQCTAAATICMTSVMCAVFCMSGTTAQVPPNACTAIPVNSLANAHVNEPAPTNMGTCNSASNHQIPMPAFASKVKACGGPQPTAEGCDAGEVCAPAPAAPFDRTCIYQPGQMQCPATGYTEQFIDYESFADGRSCSACSCGAATSQCNGDVDFSNSSCTIQYSDVPSPGCGGKNGGGQNAAAATYTPSPSGTCPPQGGTLSGSVTKNGAITFCCQP